MKAEWGARNSECGMQNEAHTRPAHAATRARLPASPTPHPERPIPHARPLLVLCGVAGSGKTAVGQRVADRLGLPFFDADDAHPPANVARMRAGTPLTDADRAPWLAALTARLGAWACEDTGGVLACSALRAAYRDSLRAGAPRLRFVLLTAPPTTLGERLSARRGHFFPPALLASQLAALEPGPDVEPVATDGRTVGEVADEVVRLLAA